MPDWVLNWSKESLIFITILTVIAVGLLKVPLRQAIIVDFAYMVIALPFAWSTRKRH
ncbi:hypothetical protein [Lactiplantibacillus daowaiensis]|uniref:Uncharacterized protein n=1 Tax=Lactiplantibacillus daowaiensis TaxID=2559918 RepID=A0ABW1S1W1_9LACO|nr:hypothetical protein [Lactiplantibacillus daowaiensis]